MLVFSNLLVELMLFFPSPLCFRMKILVGFKSKPVKSLDLNVWGANFFPIFFFTSILLAECKVHNKNLIDFFGWINLIFEFFREILIIYLLQIELDFISQCTLVCGTVWKRYWWCNMRFVVQSGITYLVFGPPCLFMIRSESTVKSWLMVLISNPNSQLIGTGDSWPMPNQGVRGSMLEIC